MPRMLKLQRPTVADVLLAYERLTPQERWSARLRISRCLVLAGWMPPLEPLGAPASGAVDVMVKAFALLPREQQWTARLQLADFFALGHVPLEKLPYWQQLQRRAE